MTLLESPTFQKRLKETLLRALLVAPKTPDESDEQPQEVKPFEKTSSYNFDREDRTKEQKAVIQSLNFNCLSPKPSVEDDNYRENLSNFHYWETCKATGDALGIEASKAPEVYWIPYVLEETAATQRTGKVDTSYPTLRGSAEEILKYAAHSGEKFEPAESVPENESGSKKPRRVYPFSVINVPLPWTSKTDKTKPLNLPTVEELVSGVRLLTGSPRREIVLMVSGPQSAATNYQRKLSGALNNIRIGRLIYPAAEIQVEQAYLCSEREAVSRFDLDFFKMSANFRQNESHWDSEQNQLKNGLDHYVLHSIEHKRAKSKLDLHLDGKNQKKPKAGYLQQSATLEARWRAAAGACSDFEKKWQAFRRTTVSIPGRQDALEFEDSCDKELNALGRLCVKEDRAPSQKEIQEISGSYAKALENYRNLQKKVAKKNGDEISLEPWALYVTVIKNTSGISERTTPSAITLCKKSWGKEEDEELRLLMCNRLRKESHLAQIFYNGMSNRDIECFYPKEEPEPLQDPAKFRQPPKEWSSPNAIKALESPLESCKVRIDVRLAPRPDLLTETFLENDNLQVQAYNPVSGRPTGIKDATLWRPIISRRGVAHIDKTLGPLGYKIECSPEVQNFVERKVKQAEKRLAPNYPLTPYESLAYFDNGSRLAETTVVHPDTGEPLWIEGKSYHITPSWKRQTMMVDHSIEEEGGSQEPDTTPSLEAQAQVEAHDLLVLGRSNSASRIENSARIQTLTERQINFGFATFIVEAEGGKTYEIRETVSKDTIALEKERIAIEIDHVLGRLEELQSKAKPTKPEASEIKNLEKRLEQKQIELDTWAPMLEDFLTAFPPEAPPLASEVYGDRIEAAAKAIYARFAPFIKHNESDKETSLKDYQLKWASVGAVKRGHLNGSVAGSGKTLVSIMASWRMGHHYNWVICPTIAMKTWAKELDRVGLYNEIVGLEKDAEGNWKDRGVVSHMRELRQRFHERKRMKNRLGKTEPEYYIVSAEQVALGGEGNKVFSPWHYDYKVEGAKKVSLEKALSEEKVSIPSHWTMGTNDKGALIVRVWSDRIDNGREIREAGFESWLRPIKFHRAIRKCPQCDASSPIWSRHGSCGRCGHKHSGITRVKSNWDAQKHHPKLGYTWSHMTARPRLGTAWEGSKTSNKQYPLYKMMGKHVGCKIIDEIHNYSNFHSQHGAALLQVRSKDSIVLSGTLCKTHISELEPSLCQVYEANSGEFPYSPWGMDLFKEQFQTIEIESTFRSRTRAETLTQEEAREVRRRTVEKIVPEASNLTKLRALLHGVMCSVGENEMETVWGLKPIRESIRYVELQPHNAAIYQEWERLLKDAYSECQTESQKIGMIRRARGQLTHLSYACDGPEKLEAAIQWIQEGMATGQRSVIVGPSTRFYTMLCKAMKERKIPFMSMGNLAPEKRFDYLNKFRDSNCPNLISRIRLINVNFNQLTCCTRILFTGIDPSPAALRQMQKRLNRIGQTKDVHCTFLISQLPPQRVNSLAEDVANTIEALETGNLTSSYDTPNSQQEQEVSENRPPSYEERLFALVLRRENAIKQTLQQADRQRDPQELYEMLKDRQTLNQLLQDIVENARSDKGVSQIIQSMVETPAIKAVQDSCPQDKMSEAQASKAGNAKLGQKQSKVRKRARCPIVTQEDALPLLPKGFEFEWRELKTGNGRCALQGELFSV